MYIRVDICVCACNGHMFRDSEMSYRTCMYIHIYKYES